MERPSESPRTETEYVIDMKTRKQVATCPILIRLLKRKDSYQSRILGSQDQRITYDII